GWKIIRLWFTLLAHQCGLGIVLVHVVRNGSEVVEEFAVHGPALVAFPDGGADQYFAELSDGLAQGKGPFAAMHHIAEAFIPGSAFIGGRSGGAKPAFVDAAALGP